MSGGTEPESWGAGPGGWKARSPPRVTLFDGDGGIVEKYHCPRDSCLSRPGGTIHIGVSFTIGLFMRSCAVVVTGSLLVLASAARAAGAQGPVVTGPPQVLASDSGAALVPVGRGVYAITHADAIHNWPDGSTDWPHGNTGVVVGERCVLVVDATFYPVRAAGDIDLIRKVTDRPVCYLVNTHWHGDHTHGNAVYKARFPDIQIVGTAENAAYIDIMQQRFGPLYAREASEPRKELARLQHIRAAGADSSGRPLSAAEGAVLARVIAELQVALHEFSGLRVATPTLLFERELTLDLGGLSARLTSRGRGNSPDDITVAVDREGVVFAGDLVVYPVPFAFGAYPTRWVEVLRHMESEPIRVLVPGHGPVMHDLKYVAQVRVLMETVMARVRTLMVTGIPLADIRQQIRLEDLEAMFVSPSIFNSGPWWRDSVVGALVERSYKCLQGSEC